MILRSIMKITIDEDVLAKYKLDLKDFFILVGMSKYFDIEDAQEFLARPEINKFISSTTMGMIRFKKDELNTFLNTIFLDSEEDNTHSITKMEELCDKLKEAYPTGKKDGTILYWTEGKKLIERRLKLFFKKYGNYNYEDIIDATKRYVQSFDGNYSYMKVLKYFIFKEKIGANREVEGESELLNYLENKSQVNSQNDNWVVSVR